MPSFHTVDGNRSAWSAFGRLNSKSQRVGAGDRPEAEVRLSGRKIEIRTGARVRRARGAWTNIKRVGTGLLMLFNGVSTRNLHRARLRNAEFRFDRHINRLVEDLANKPGQLSSDDIARRFGKIKREAQMISRLGGGDKQALLERCEKNFQESLDAVAKTKPEALRRSGCHRVRLDAVRSTTR